MTKRPNILFILSDQHSAKALGHEGHPNALTPHLDRMAAEGVRFTNALTQNPICTPSRVSFLSGQYAHNHGYYGLSGPRPAGLPSLFGHFGQAGYTTALFGKSHLPEYWAEDECDVFHDTAGTSILGRSPAYTQFLEERGKLHLEDSGPLPEFPQHPGSTMEGRPSPLAYEESQEGWITGQAIEFMQEAAAERRPFFVHVSFPRPHASTSPSEPFWSMYDSANLVLPPNADYDMSDKAPHLRKMAAYWRSGDWTLIPPRTFEAGRLRKLHGYLGAVSQVDHSVGLLLEFLRASGLADETIVVYSADHGEYNCEHGIMEKAPGICADAVTRIPYIWWAPGRVMAGHTAPELVEAVDLSATLCSLAHLEPMETSDGKDLAPLLHGDRSPVHDIGVTEFAWSKSVRKGQFRYVYYPRAMFASEYPAGFAELYDLETDPWEMRNLFVEPEYRNVVAELRENLLEWLVTTTRPGTILGLNCGKRLQLVDNRQRVRRHRCITNRDGKIHPHEIRRAETLNYV